MTLSTYDKYQLRARTIHHEGERSKPYIDSVGNVTIGMGHNLTENGLSDKMIQELFEQDLAIAEEELRGFLWWHKLDGVRQGVLIELNFNIGIKSFNTFKRMIANVELGDFRQASLELINSLWYTQVGGERGLHMATVLETGHYS